MIDTLVASDLPVMAKAFFVTVLLLACAVALGAGSALIAFLLRALPSATVGTSQSCDGEPENPRVELSAGRTSANSSTRFQETSHGRD